MELKKFTIQYEIQNGNEALYEQWRNHELLPLAYKGMHDFNRILDKFHEEIMFIKLSVTQDAEYDYDYGSQHENTIVRIDCMITLDILDPMLVLKSIEEFVKNESLSLTISQDKENG